MSDLRKTSSLLNTSIRFITGKPINKNVIFHGAQSHKFDQNKLLNSSIFLQHSIKDSNGDMKSQYISLIEAMAFGLPVFTTNHNGFKDTVSNNLTRYLVNEKRYYNNQP